MKYRKERKNTKSRIQRDEEKSSNTTHNMQHSYIAHGALWNV